MAAILIVDDNEPTARALSALLRRANYRVAPFHTGSAALAYAEQHPCLAALVDIHLPDVNGLLLSQKLRDRFGPSTPIVILSGDTSLGTLNSLAQVGATHFFSKPVNAPHLLAQLDGFIRDAGRQKAG